MRPYASLRGRREFALAMRRGIAKPTPAFTIFGFAPGGQPRAQARGGQTRGAQPRSERPRVGVVVPRAVGKAVVRNRLRRRCKAILDHAGFGGTPRWYVIACRAEAARLSFAELKKQLLDAFVATRDAKPQPASGRDRGQRRARPKS